MPAAATGVCHKTVDCEECAGIKKEAVCRQKLGIWVPEVHVIASAEKEATKDKAELNEQVSFHTHAHAPSHGAHLNLEKLEGVYVCSMCFVHAGIDGYSLRKWGKTRTIIYSYFLHSNFLC